MDKRDDIFLTNSVNTPFEFNETVAAVFDDMINRSVPLYREMIRQQSRLAAKFYQNGTFMYDLGCSNGNFAASLISEAGDRDFRLIAVDNSGPMLDLFRKRISGFSGSERITPFLADVLNIDFEPSSVIIANLTLQFIPIMNRQELIKKIYSALKPGGILLLTEKTINPDETLSELQQEFYHRFKEENGYSKIEISRKRDALENVLVPETVERHMERLASSGFRSIELWLKWFHFASFICRKDG